MKRKKNPWTQLRNRLKPLILEIHAASVWRVVSPLSVEKWLKSLTWYQLLHGDMICEQLCQEPPQLTSILFSLTQATGRDDEEQRVQDELICQVMHRLLYAVDLSNKMSAGWQREVTLTGDYVHDSRAVLIGSWRMNIPMIWAREIGEIYVAEEAW